MELIVGLLVFGIIGFVFFAYIFVVKIPVLLWLEARACSVDISLMNLFLMMFRGVSPASILKSTILAAKADISGIEPERFEAHFLAGGDIHNVIIAMIRAREANLSLDFRLAAAIDLSGRDVLEAVETCAREGRSLVEWFSQ